MNHQGPASASRAEGAVERAKASPLWKTVSAELLQDSSPGSLRQVSPVNWTWPSAMG
jgi:hypothetical protein